MLVNIEVTHRRCVAVDRAVLGVVQRGLHSEPTQIGLDPPADRVTLRAADKAALAVPITRSDAKRCVAVGEEAIGER